MAAAMPNTELAVQTRHFEALRTLDARDAIFH